MFNYEDNKFGGVVSFSNLKVIYKVFKKNLNLIYEVVNYIVYFCMIVCCRNVIGFFCYIIIINILVG